MIVQIAAPPTGHSPAQKTANSNCPRFGRPLRLRRRGMSEDIPPCQDVPIIPLYRSAQNLWMNLVAPESRVMPVEMQQHCTDEHVPLP
jgi:hypothetical protein